MGRTSLQGGAATTKPEVYPAKVVRIDALERQAFHVVCVGNDAFHPMVFKVDPRVKRISLPIALQ